MRSFQLMRVTCIHAAVFQKNCNRYFSRCTKCNIKISFQRYFKITLKESKNIWLEQSLLSYKVLCSHNCDCICKNRPYGQNYSIHFLPVDESHTNALSRLQSHQALKTRWPGLLYQAISSGDFSNAVKPRGCISWPV